MIATVRKPSAELDALAARYPGGLEIETVDIDEADAVKALRGRLKGRRLDVLFVNAGISRGAIKATPASADERDFLDTAGDVIAVMTSGLGSIANSSGGWALYSASKAALNMLMKGFAARRPDDKRALLLVAPGWVRTDMGGAGATFSIEESIPLVVDMVEANRGGPGLRYLDRFNKALPW